jgi:hypothetical protein
MKHPHYGPSNHQPATGIGETLHLDLNQLPVPAALTGATHEIMIVDEKTGEISAVGADNKTGMSLMASDYRSACSMSLNLKRRLRLSMVNWIGTMTLPLTLASIFTATQMDLYRWTNQVTSPVC